MATAGYMINGPPSGRSSLLDRLGSYPCAALAFNEEGYLVAANQQASDLHAGG